MWLAEYCGGIKDTTRDKYDMYIRLYIKPLLGAFKLQALGGHVIQSTYNKPKRREKRPLSAKSISNLHGVLHGMLAQALKLGYTRSNPCKAVSLPRVERKEMQALQDTKLDEFLDAVKGQCFESVYLGTYLPACGRVKSLA